MQLVKPCRLYSGEFLLGFLHLRVRVTFLFQLQVMSAGYDSGPKFVNMGCVKRKQKNTQKGENKMQREQMLATSCAFSKCFHLMFFFLPLKC